MSATLRPTRDRGDRSCALCLVHVPSHQPPPHIHMYIHLQLPDSCACLFVPSLPQPMFSAFSAGASSLYNEELDLDVTRAGFNLEGAQEHAAAHVCTSALCAALPARGTNWLTLSHCILLARQHATLHVATCARALCPVQQKHSATVCGGLMRQRLNRQTLLLLYARACSNRAACVPAPLMMLCLFVCVQCLWMILSLSMR